MRSTTLLLPALLAASALGLVGCSSPSPSPSSDASSDAAAAFTCDSGTLTIPASAPKKLNITADCDTIVVKASNAFISLPSTTSVEISGSKNSVTVEKAAKIAVSGDSNTVFYGAAEKPSVDDSGTSNTVGQR